MFNYYYYYYYCKTCQSANQKRLLDSSMCETVHLYSDSVAYTWKHAVESFNDHNKLDSLCRVAVSILESAEGINIHSSLSRAGGGDNRCSKVFLASHCGVSCLPIQARIVMTTRGKTDSTVNFNELLSLRANDVIQLQPSQHGKWAPVIARMGL